MNAGAPEWVCIAHLVRPQGRMGEVLAEILTDFPELFSKRPRLYLATPTSPSPVREVLVEDAWLHKNRVVLKFAGVDSITDAEGLRGLDVMIPREERAPLEDGGIYISDLRGCLLMDVSTDPREVGNVLDVDTFGGGAPLLIVQSGSSREELLVPFVKSWLRRVSVEEKLVEMALPAGLLEINAPLTSEERRIHHEAAPE